MSKTTGGGQRSIVFESPLGSSRKGKIQKEE
jgi:hypothetical protein